MKTSLMIKYFLSTIFIAAIVVSCNQSPAGDKREELDGLKKQQAELKNKIAKLEEEVSKNDTTKNNKIKIVSATPMAPQTFTHFIEVQAKVEGDEDVNLSAEMPGTITAVMVKP